MQSLATKYRPSTFPEICGQQSIIKILDQQIETKQVSNAYIFAGPSGCGKTTMARAFASKLNKAENTAIEIDAASNNGVDNVRDIIANASERSLSGEYKVIIMDEAHMLTIQAWNAFLKCIEEPPTYTIFIFCTTDPQKIPPTIVNRCLRLNLTRISVDKIRDRLRYICEKEQFTNYEDACDYISRICKGQMRDAISLLEKCSTYDKNLSIENVLTALGNYSYDTMFDLLNNLIDGNESMVLTIIDGVNNSGNDIKLFMDQFLAFCLDVNKYSLLQDIGVTQFPVTLMDKLKLSVGIENCNNYYAYLTNRLLQIKNEIRNDTDPLTTVSVELLGICRCQ